MFPRDDVRMVFRGRSWVKRETRELQKEERSSEIKTVRIQKRKVRN